MKIHLPSAPALLLAVAAGATLLACAVKAPPRTTWTIVAPGDAPAARRDAAGPALGVARFTAAPEVRTTDMLWRTDGGRLLHEAEEQWVDYPDRMLEELTRAALLESGRFSSVTPAPPVAGTDATLTVRVLDFSEWHDGQTITARVVMEWRLRSASGQMLGQDVVSASSPLAVRSAAGVVTAFQAASSDVIARVVDAVAIASATR